MAFRSIGTKTGASTAGIAIPVPAGNVADDIVVVGFYMESTATVTPPAGFTVKADLNTSAATHGRMIVAWKRLTGTDSGTYSFTWTGATFCAGAAAAFSGRITAGDPFDVAPGTNEPGSTGTTAPVSTSPTTALCDAVGCWTDFSGSGSWTPPSGYTEQFDGPVFTMVTQDAIGSGSTGSITATQTSTDWIKGFLGTLTPSAGPVDTGYIVQEDGTSKLLLESGTGAIIGENFVASGNFNGTASVSASNTRTAAGVVGALVGATLAATSTITATGVVGRSSGASIAATDTITAAGSAAAAGFNGTASLAGTGTITASGLVALATGSSIAATDTITATGVVARSSGVTLSPAATISAAGVVGEFAGATLAGTDTITAAGVVATSSGASISATAAITATGTAGAAGGQGAALGAVGALTATGTRGALTGASLAASDALIASGVRGTAAGASVSSTAALSSAGAVARSSSATIAETAVLTAAGVVARSSGAILAGTATIAAAGSVVDVSEIDPADVQVTLRAAVIPRRLTARTLDRSLAAAAVSGALTARTLPRTLTAAAHPRTLEED